MELRVYNTLSHKKESFQPVKPGQVGIYLCGPTVYKPSHIGHAVGPIIFDVIKRYLVHKGYQVRWVVNVTDVDDKLIVEAQEQGTTVFELAERILSSYLESLARLNISSIDDMPKASKHVDDIIEMIEKLIAKNAAYVMDGDVYFDVTADADYGKLSGRNVEDQQSHRDLESGEKRNPGDFALWKAAKPHEPVDVKFDSPWGAGRPGWHIECSAMSSRYLGETFDIHGGGMDLIFPHHENEIAQSESSSGQTFARYWLHHGLTRFNTKKVSKSDSEMAEALKKMTLTTLLDKYGGELLRYFVLSTHYRRPIEFSDAEVESKRRGLSAFHRLFERAERACGQSPYVGEGCGLSAWPSAERGSFEAFGREVDGLVERFFEAMDDDFNTAAALAAMFEATTRVNRFFEEHHVESADADSSAKVLALSAVRAVLALGRVMGLFQSPPEAAQEGDGLVDKLMAILIQARADSRKAKQFAVADMIRDQLTAAGVTLEDRPEGTVWRR